MRGKEYVSVVNGFMIFFNGNLFKIRVLFERMIENDKFSMGI